MELMRTLLLLEDSLMGAMEFQLGEPWGLMAALEPALFRWTVDKLELLQGWMQRLMSAELWKPVTMPQGCARCPEATSLGRKACLCHQSLLQALPLLGSLCTPHQTHPTRHLARQLCLLHIRWDGGACVPGDEDHCRRCFISEAGNGHASRSCVETMKIADETLDALFDMELPLPRPVVRSLAEGIDTILQKWALLSLHCSCLRLWQLARDPVPAWCAYPLTVQGPGTMELRKPTVRASVPMLTVGRPGWAAS
jgi:hypothetical protein